MTTQQLTPEQMAQLLEQMTAAGGIDQLKKFAEMANEAVKDTRKADKEAETAQLLKIHNEKSDGLREAATAYFNTAYPDDGTPESKNQTVTMLIECFRDADGRRVSVKLPKVKSSNPTGERLRGSAFIPLHAKLCFGQTETESIAEYLKYLGITYSGASPHDRLRQEVDKLIDGKAVMSKATSDNLMIKHEKINGGAATRMVDHQAALNAAKA